MATTSKTFFPHHRVSIRYPFAPQDYPRRDQFTMLPVRNAADRYEPICLTADTQVAENQIHTSQTASIFSYSGVRAVGPEDLQATLTKLRTPFDESESDVECLVREMALWTAYNGFSYLDIMTYNHVHPGKNPEIYVHIQRHSLLELGGAYGQSIREDSSYEIPLSTFEASPTTAIWHTNALDVLHRTSDRAVHHTNLYLKNHHLPDIDVHWREERKPDYALAGSRPGPQNIPARCYVCMQSFVTAGIVPLQLPCDHRHVLCTDCWSRWAEQNGIENVGCPHCRAKIDADVAGTIKWGTQDRAYNRNQLGNHRFNDFETFVRQTSDLDVEAGDQNDGELKVHSELLNEIWKHLTTGALLETAASTPLHLQAVRSPEFQLVSSLAQDLFEHYHGQTWTASDLYQAWAKDIRTALKDDFRHSHAFSAILQSEQLPFVNDGAIDSYIRPGVMTFILRTLSRMIQFDLLRECHDPTPGCAAVWHMHGVKAYYNMEQIPKPKETELERMLREMAGN
ncbi:hypothetical protein LTR10_008730 [Elasticomyces elasticus]|nr:hypothetical protein LTR10_008730 [Elasticomyces elasticus]KAK4974296.1 hypothetical protein LTR42_004938 [Elasticomyces elasticus]